MVPRPASPCFLSVSPLMPMVVTRHKWPRPTGRDSGREHVPSSAGAAKHHARWRPSLCQHPPPSPHQSGPRPGLAAGGMWAGKELCVCASLLRHRIVRPLAPLLLSLSLLLWWLELFLCVFKEPTYSALTTHQDCSEDLTHPSPLIFARASAGGTVPRDRTPTQEVTQWVGRAQDLAELSPTRGMPDLHPHPLQFGATAEVGG